jgi:phage terminase large subunit
MSGSSRRLIEPPKAFKPLWRPARYKGAHGGRGSGKSHAFAELLIVRASTAKGFRAACLREIQKSLKNSVKLLVEDKIKALGVGHLFEVLEAEIKTPGGGVIMFQGMQNHTADSIKSLEGFDVAWVEEAQSLSQRSLDLLRPTIRKPGSELWFSWNPGKPADPVDVLLRGENPPRDAVVVEVNYRDNNYLPVDLLNEQEDDLARDPDKWAHVWGGGYSLNSEARVFRNWRVQKFEAPKDAIHRFGADWGFALDPTALVRCHVEGRTLYVDYEAVEVGCEIDETPYLFSGEAKPKDWPIGEAFVNGPTIDSPKRAIRQGVPRAERDLIRADSARPETVSYMRRHGYRITAALKGPGSLEDGIQFLKMFDIVVHPRCANVINELTLYGYKVDPHTEEILSELDDKNNHTIDALRYALEELRRSGYKPKPKEPSRDPSDLHQWGRQNDRGSADWKTI